MNETAPARSKDGNLNFHFLQYNCYNFPGGESALFRSDFLSFRKPNLQEETLLNQLV
jgi:hypothetical protein